MNDNSNSLTILSDRQRKFLGFVACFASVLILGCLLAAVIIILNRTFDLFGVLSGLWLFPVCWPFFFVLLYHSLRKR